MFGRLGWAEILVIVVLLLILFGHNKIPGMMKNLADGINVFKRELKKPSKKAEDKKAEMTLDEPKKVKKSGVKRPVKKKTKK